MIPSVGEMLKANHKKLFCIKSTIIWNNYCKFKCFKMSTFGQTIIMLCSCDKETHMHQVNVMEFKKYSII